jgi:hypothetical protein
MFRQESKEAVMHENSRFWIKITTVELSEPYILRILNLLRNYADGRNKKLIWFKQIKSASVLLIHSTSHS